MNHYLKSQIMNMITMTEAFTKACHMAALQNDGQMDKDETIALKKIDKATERFLKDIKSVINEKP